MKKIFLVLILLVNLVACNKNTNSENEISKLLAESYAIEASTFDENEWKGLLSKDEDHLIVKAKLNKQLYEEGNEVFFEEDKYLAFIKKLEISEIKNINDQIPSKDDLQKYVGKTFGELEDEGFENTGYCESDNYQYNFTYENNVICIVVKSSADTPIKNMDDFSVNDIRALVVSEIVDFYVSGNVLYNE